MNSAIASLADRYPNRASAWRLRTRSLQFSGRPLLMGIVNVTPDSFSDGGSFLAAEAAIEHGLRLIDEGADLIDIGGESTRPYAEPVSLETELARVIPVIEALASRTNTPLSVDTSKSLVALAGIETGAEIVNDITGLMGDPAMLGVCQDLAPGVCAMHIQGTPQTMQDNPSYGNVVEDIYGYLAARRDALIAAGLSADQLCLDPGIGFGKTHQHNLSLLADCGRFHELRCPLLVGHSRKGFIGKVLGDKEADRTAATIGAALSLAVQGVQILRVHDVRPIREALLLFEATGGIDGQAGRLDESRSSSQNDV